MGWLIALGILVLLAVLPLGVSIRYDASGTLVRLIAGPVRITLYPRAKKKGKQEKTADQTDAGQEKTPEKKKSSGKKAAAGQTAKQAEKPAEPKKESGGPITDFLPLVQILLEMLGAFRRKLRMNLLEMKIVMAADDPCDLAVNYGRMNASLAALIAQLERVLVIQKRDVHVDCDFTASETVILARLDLTITLGRILSIAVRHGVRGLMTFLKIKKQREGGADL